MRWSDLIGPQYVEYRFPRRQEIVGNYPPMAPPPEGLSAHYCTCLYESHFAKSRQAGPKLATHGVVGIIVKTPILPKRIDVRRHIPLLAAQAAERRDMLVADFKLRQGLGEIPGVVLGVGPRSRNGSDIDDDFDLL